MSKQIYKIRGKYSSPIWEFADKKNISGFQSILVDQNDFGYAHELNLTKEIGKKFFNKLKNSYLQSGGNVNDYIELYFVAAQDQYDQWYIVDKSIKYKLIVKHDSNYEVVKSFQKSVDTFGYDDNGKPIHRLAYNYVNSERISRGEMPSTLQEYYDNAPIILGRTFKELADTENLLNL